MFSDSSSSSETETRGMIAQIQAKMRKLADEFALGEVNREQFYKIYEHYQTQLNLVSAMLDEVEMGNLPSLSSMETIAIRKRLTAVAQAASVYHHANGQVVETIGDFNVQADVLRPIYTAITDKLAKHGTPPEVQIQQWGREWLLVVAGQWSTVVMVFSHEPISRQIAIVQNMHRDFETANEAALVSGDMQAAKLVYPFVSFVKKATRKSSKS